MKNIFLISIFCVCLCSGMKEKECYQLLDEDTTKSDEQKSPRQKKKGKIKVICADNTQDGRETQVVVIEETPKTKKVKVRVFMGTKK